jgi:hypothetical protein
MTTEQHLRQRVIEVEIFILSLHFPSMFSEQSYSGLNSQKFLLTYFSL